jgi:hypothetical protein
MLVLAACTGLDKSENVLSPTVAGPIPGVAIGMPTLLDPRDGKNIPVGSQVIDLLIQNSPTNGQRPLSYRFEVATDANFSTLLYMKEGTPPRRRQSHIAAAARFDGYFAHLLLAGASGRRRKHRSFLRTRGLQYLHAHRD